MPIDVIPASIFIAISTFTPGPANITSAGMGMLFGYRKTFRFLLGCMAGYLSTMLTCAFLAGEVLQAIPTAEPILRISGAIYLLYLAYGAARTAYTFDTEQRPMSFFQGFCLQTLNPKAIVFGLTIYTTFLMPLAPHPYWRLLSVILLSALAFSSVSIWALSGASIRRFLHLPNIRIGINSLLTLLLIYCAISISGALNFL